VDKDTHFWFGTQIRLHK